MCICNPRKIVNKYTQTFKAVELRDEKISESIAAQYKNTSYTQPLLDDYPKSNRLFLIQSV